jgi:hypothetical protein
MSSFSVYVSGCEVSARRQCEHVTDDGLPDELPVALSACELSTRFGSSCFFAVSMVLTR